MKKTTEDSIDLKINTIKSEIINIVKAISVQEQGKKDMASSFKETIGALKKEKESKLVQLEELQRLALEEEADEILTKAG